MSMMTALELSHQHNGAGNAGGIDWREVAHTALLSRALDDFELSELVPQGKAKYQFSSGGHELGQAILSQLLDRPFDWAHVYYRCRPFMLGSGLTATEALLNTMALSGSLTEGRDLPAVFHLPRRRRAVIPPNAADIGSQFCVAAGTAQAIRYRVQELGESDKANSVAVVYGGDGAVASVGFWSMLNAATTLRLPLLIVIENNGYAISTHAWRQTPGGNVAENLASFGDLAIWDGDGTEPEEAARLTQAALQHVRDGYGVALLHLTMPRLCAHSGVDTAAYKTEAEKAAERLRDPLPKLQRYCIERMMTAREWDELAAAAQDEVRAAYAEASRRPDPPAADATRFAFYEAPHVQLHGGLRAEGIGMPSGDATPRPTEQRRLTMVEAIRRTLDVELSLNPRLLMCGEDIAVKGGVHSVTQGLAGRHGEARVFDTSLNEEAIIGRAVGMALAGLMPVPEIQYRKYVDACYESINNCGALRWRSANHFAAPLVVRTSGGYRKVGDPWHSVTSEVTFTHMTGWRVAVPSNAEDAVGLLRAAMRGDDPTLFFEHRFCYDSPWSRRPYPGDAFVLPFGKARLITTGSQLTVVTWGAMVELCEEAARQLNASVDLIDLRTLSPWDKEAALTSVQKTGKCLIVHEDAEFGGFGAEIAATIAAEAFFDLDAPVARVASPLVPVPFSATLMTGVVPDVDKIRAKMEAQIRL
jgi:2-oxoisovalerate dehydrogenase E1 component